jgi:hypothetical protein
MMAKKTGTKKKGATKTTKSGKKKSPQKQVF